MPATLFNILIRRVSEVDQPHFLSCYNELLPRNSWQELDQFYQILGNR